MMEPGESAAGTMEFQRDSLWAGIFVLLALAIFLALAALAVHQRFFRQEYPLHTTFPRIEGLRPGADVMMRGHVVGRVRDITLTTTPEVAFAVDFSVAREVSLPAGTRARLTGSFAGTVLDLVTPGDSLDPDSPPAPPPDRPRAFLEPGMSLPGIVGVSLETLFTDAYALGRQLSGTLERTDDVINRRLGPRLDETLASVSKDLESLMAELERTLEQSREVLSEAGQIMEESRPRVATLLETANRDMEAVEGIARRLDGLLAELEGRVLPVLDRAGDGLGKADRVLGKLDQALDPEKIETVLDNLVTVSTEADLLVKELRRRPWRLLRRVRGEKKELIRELEARREAEARENQDNEQTPPSP